MKKERDIRIWIERVLFSSKWFLVPFYLGLMVALLNFLVIDVKEVFEFIRASDLSKTSAMMFILELIDMAMVAALVRMIVIGGYTSFICKNHSDDGEKTSSGALKVKLGTAIIGVSSIALLQIFMTNATPAVAGETIHRVSWEVVQQLLWIHLAFLIGAVVLSVIDYLHVKSESLNHGDIVNNSELIDKKHFKKDVCVTKKELLTEEGH